MWACTHVQAYTHAGNRMLWEGVFCLPASGGDALHLVQREAAVRVSGLCECKGVHARVLCHDTTHAEHCKTGERERGGAERVKILVSAREARIGRWAARGGRERAGKTKEAAEGTQTKTCTHTKRERHAFKCIHIPMCVCVCAHAHTL